MRQSVRAIVIKDGALLVMGRNKFGNQYFSLIGGGIDPGETAEQALHREVMEESGLTISDPKLVFEQIGGPRFGQQFVFVCKYVSGEPALQPNSVEAKQHIRGQNLFEPQWLPLSELAEAKLLPAELKAAILDGLKNGWPSTPIKLTISE